jgi:hypothetical protein
MIDLIYTWRLVLIRENQVTLPAARSKTVDMRGDAVDFRQHVPLEPPLTKMDSFGSGRPWRQGNAGQPPHT